MFLLNMTFSDSEVGIWCWAIGSEVHLVFSGIEVWVRVRVWVGHLRALPASETTFIELALCDGPSRFTQEATLH